MEGLHLHIPGRTLLSSLFPSPRPFSEGLVLFSRYVQVIVDPSSLTSGTLLLLGRLKGRFVWPAMGSHRLFLFVCSFHSTLLGRYYVDIVSPLIPDAFISRVCVFRALISWWRLGFRFPRVGRDFKSACLDLVLEGRFHPALTPVSPCCCSLLVVFLFFSIVFYMAYIRSCEYGNNCWSMCSVSLKNKQNRVLTKNGESKLYI